VKCDEEYIALVKATEKLHDLYYQQETADTQFSNALRAAENHLIAAGLVRLVNATPVEIIYSLEESSEKSFSSLHEAAVAKSQVDVKAAAAEESFQYASQRYENCLKENSKDENSN